MKKSNKGYTLVELLVTISIFAIVMVGIISIMRTTSVSFRNENLEINVQQDAQILTAQVEDLLLDCTSISRTANNTSVLSYKIVDKDGTHYLKYDKIAKELSLSDDNTNYSLLSANVDSFNITGLKADDSKDDNSCTVSATVSQATNGSSSAPEYKYSCSESVYFRNNVDGNTKFELDLSNVAGGSSGGGGNTRTYNLGRYEVLNLKAEFGIVNVVSAIATGNNGFEFLDPSKEVNGGLPNAASCVVSTSGPTYWVRPTNTANLSPLNSYSMTLVGTTADNVTLTVSLTIKKVSINKGSGYLYKNTANVNDPGYFSYINVEGLCLPHYLKYYNGRITADIKVNENGTYKGTMSGSLYNLHETSRHDFSSVSTSAITLKDMGLYYDPVCYEMIALRSHNSDSTTYANPTKLSGTKVELNVILNVPTTGNTVVGISETFRLICNGATLN